MSRSSGSTRYFIGLLLVILGVMLLLDNTGALGLDWSLAGVYWPSLIIAWALWRLVVGGFRSRLWPTIALLVGVVLQLSNLGLWDWNFGQLLWPALLVAVGLMLLFGRGGRGYSRGRSVRRGRRGNNPSPPGRSSAATATASGSTDDGADDSTHDSAGNGTHDSTHDSAGNGTHDSTHDSAGNGTHDSTHDSAGNGTHDSIGGSAGAVWRGTSIFGGIEDKIVAQDFRDGEAVAILGGIDLDLRQAKLSNGQATLDVTSIFGGIRLRVPRGWRVNLRNVTLFGSVEHNREQPDPEAETGVLTIVGTALFGGLEVSD